LNLAFLGKIEILFGREARIGVNIIGDSTIIEGHIGKSEKDAAAKIRP